MAINWDSFGKITNNIFTYLINPISNFMKGKGEDKGNRQDTDDVNIYPGQKKWMDEGAMADLFSSTNISNEKKLGLCVIFSNWLYVPEQEGLRETLAAAKDFLREKLEIVEEIVGKDEKSGEDKKTTTKREKRVINRPGVKILEYLSLYVSGENPTEEECEKVVMILKAIGVVGPYRNRIEQGKKINQRWRNYNESLKEKNTWKAVLRREIPLLRLFLKEG